MHPLMFWGLVVAVWFLLQIPYAGLPFSFLSTWAHELGHGMGAVITGGHFDHMIITPKFGGLAQTAVLGKFEEIIVVIGGLLGPTIAGALMLISARGLGQNRFGLGVLAALLLATSLLWAGDGFTRIGTVAIGIFVMGAVVVGSAFFCSLLAHIVAISLCLSAVTRLDYFFVEQGPVAGNTHVSDTGVLSALVGGHHLMWGAALSFLSILILYAAYRMSSGKSKS